MKNKIIFGILLIALLFSLSGCSSEFKTEEVPKRLVKVYNDYNYQIIVDTRTNVEYLICRRDSGTALTVLVNQDGTPLLYGGE